MLRFLFALAAVVVALVWAGPLIRRWVLPPPESQSTALVATLALSLGWLTLWMLGLGLLPGSAFTFEAALAVPVTGLAIGLWILRLRLANVSRPATPRQAQLAMLFDRRRPETWARMAILVSLVVITLNLVYYPFYVSDALSRYALFARRIFETGRIPNEVQGYPLLASLGYAFAFLAAGGVNDYLAGVVGAALAAGLVIVSGVLAVRMFGRRAGWAAAFLAATSPLFVIWATSGYVDIPAGFYFGACALFAWRWLEGGQARFALLAGVMAGLAMWTKQSGFTLFISLVGVAVLSALWRPGSVDTAEAQVHRSPFAICHAKRPFATRSGHLPREAAIRHSALALLLMLGMAALVAGPWYARNYLLAGIAGVFPLPGAWYAAQADHRVIALFPFATRAVEWGWPLALLGGAGLLFALGEVVLGGDGRRRALFLLAFLAPYHLAWWWSFSYELRFLLTLLPFYVAMAGRLVDVVLTRVRWPLPWPLVAGALSAVALLGVWPRLGAVYHLVREPLASEASKRARLQPDLWYTVSYLQTHARLGQDAIQVLDGSYNYFLTDYRTRTSYPVTLGDLAGIDYFVVPGWAPAMYASLGHADSDVLASLSDHARFQEVFRSPVANGSVVYRVVAAR